MEIRSGFRVNSFDCKLALTKTTLNTLATNWQANFTQAILAHSVIYFSVLYLTLTVQVKSALIIENLLVIRFFGFSHIKFSSHVCILQLPCLISRLRLRLGKRARRTSSSCLFSSRSRGTWVLGSHWALGGVWVWWWGGTGNWPCQW